MRARTALAAILLGALVTGLMLLRDHGPRLWAGVHVQKVCVLLSSENLQH